MATRTTSLPKQYELVFRYNEALQKLQTTQTHDFKHLSGWWWNYVYLSGGIAKFEMKTKTV